MSLRYLAYLIAPKLSRKLQDGTYTTDEPYAWETREFLRKKLIGKEVSFRVEYKLPFGSTQRECAIVFLGDENINETLVTEGLAEVVKRNQNKDNPDVIRLTELEDSAKSASVGKWSSGEKAVSRVLLQEVEDGQPLIGQTFEGIVEHVRDGSTLRVGLILPQSTPTQIQYQVISLVLSGVRSPQSSEPFGEEAKYFTESRLLQRDVQVRLEQMNNNNFVGTLTFLERDIAEYLLREGYAKCLDWTIGLTKDPKKLRAVELEAKTKKLRLWKDYVSTTAAPSSDGKPAAKDFEAKVVEIVSPEALVVQNIATKEVKKIFLASIRSPKAPADSPAPVDRKQFRPLYDIPYFFEAREFLRKKLIGKNVKVHIDYLQPKSEQFPEKLCCTVVTTNDSTNVGEALIARGLATVVRYRSDDDKRCSDYDSFLAAEQKAQQSQKGIYSGDSEQGLVRIVDLSTDQTKSKSFAPFLTRAAGVKREAVVEYLFPSATKVKVYVPKDNCLLNLVISGVNTPKMNDPIAVEAVNHAKLKILQRDVHIDIETTDKAGNFIGSLYFERTNNLAVELVRNGFLSVRDYNKNADLNKAEVEAKAARKGIWKDWKEEVAADDLDNGDDLDQSDDEVKPEDGSDSTKASNGKSVDLDLASRKKVVISNVADDFTTIHAQYVSDGPKIEELLVRLREEARANPPTPGAYIPKRGDLVMAKFSVDQEWYRCKVEKVLNSSEAQVLYIDYGNRETLNVKSIANLPLGNFTSLPAAAREYSLAFVFPDKDPEIAEEVKQAFLEETADKVLLLKSEYKDAQGLDAVTLLDEATKEDIVLKLVKDGWLFVDYKSRRERKLQKRLNDYKQAQESAKREGVSLTLI